MLFTFLYTYDFSFFVALLIENKKPSGIIGWDESFLPVLIFKAVNSPQLINNYKIYSRVR